MANERLRALEEVEKEIAMVLQCAGEDNLHFVRQTTMSRYCKWRAFTSVLRHLLFHTIVGYGVAGNIVLELSKDKHNASLLDRQLVQFQSSVNRVESELSGQIRYLTQVMAALLTPHNICAILRPVILFSFHRLLLGSPTKVPRIQPGRTVRWRWTEPSMPGSNWENWGEPVSWCWSRSPRREPTWAGFQTSPHSWNINIPVGML